jgi:O-antigen/teichoic acid export membrane protein
LTAGLQLINGRTDILLLGIFRPDAEVGIYNVAVQIAALVIFGLRVVNAIQAPHIAHLYAEGDMQRLQKMITKSSRAVLTTTVPIVLVIMVFGDEIIRIAFGGEYRGAYIPLVILSVGQLINASMGSVANLLNMTGHERDTTRSIFIGAVVNLTLGFGE